LQLSNDAFPHPPVIADHLRTLRYAIYGLSSAAHTILSSLSTTLFLPAGQRFEDFQGLTRPSPDTLRLLKYHANPNSNVVSQTPHTDIGSLTFVFSTTPGLQVLPAHIGRGSACSESDWRYVLPKPGHAVVNIGDCISMMTNGLLKSALHRVGTVPGCDMPERYSLAYLMRPEEQTLLRGLDSPLIPQSMSNASNTVTSGEWIQKKFTALRGKKDVSNQMDQILTMGRGVLV
jgi:isopenicillin N synthase-like dioxygenase